MLVLFPFPNALNATRISNYIWLKSRVNVWVNIPVPWSMWNSFASQAENQSEVMHTQHVFNPFRGFLLVSSRFLQGKKSYLFLPLSPSFPKKKTKKSSKKQKKISCHGTDFTPCIKTKLWLHFDTSTAEQSETSDVTLLTCGQSAGGKVMILKANPMTNKCLANTPIGSMYGIFTYIWLIFMVNVGECAIYGSYGIEYRSRSSFCRTVFDVNSTYAQDKDHKTLGKNTSSWGGNVLII